MASDKSFIKSTRLSKEQNEIITAIADFEDRTTSKVIERLLRKAIDDYLKENFSGKFGDYLMLSNNFLYNCLEQIPNDDNTGPRYL